MGVKITGKSYRNWLERKAIKTKVGFTKDPQKNPIARFFKQEYPNVIDAKISLDSNYVFLTLEENEKRLTVKKDLPQWVKNYIHEINSFDSKSISAKKALNTFDVVYGHLR